MLERSASCLWAQLVSIWLWNVWKVASIRMSIGTLVLEICIFFFATSNFNYYQFLFFFLKYLTNAYYATYDVWNCFSITYVVFVCVRVCLYLIMFDFWITIFEVVRDEKTLPTQHSLDALIETECRFLNFIFRFRSSLTVAFL